MGIKYVLNLSDFFKTKNLTRILMKYKIFYFIILGYLISCTTTTEVHNVNFSLIFL